MKDERATAEPRYVFVDGLRGLAALAVVCHHLQESTPLGPTLGRILPGPLRFFCYHGGHGVEVFFIISGFVIAHALRHVEPTPAVIGNFILRRQLRLDPPYWATLAVVMTITAIESRLPGLVTPRTLPSAGNVLANLFYVQSMLGTPLVLGVAWTLCLEVQFYLVFIFILAFTRAAVGGVTIGPTPFLAVAMVAGLGLLSLGSSAVSADHPTWFVSDHPIWFVSVWFYFGAGVLCYWHLRGRLRAWVFWSFIGAFGLEVCRQPAVGPVVGLVTVLALHAVGRAGRLTSWLGGPVLGYLGRISYSLYLIHLPVLLTIMRAGYKLTGDHRGAALVWFALAALASLGAGHLLYVLVEAPSLRLTARLRPRPAGSSGPGHVAEVRHRARRRLKSDLAPSP